MGQIATFLENHTCKISQFDTSRSYFSMSHCGKSIEDQWDMYINGFEDGPLVRLRCYKGYQMERDLRMRAKSAFPKEFEEFHPELSAFDGLVKGHPDFLWEGNPGDFKSVLLDEYLPKTKLPRKVYWQMQAYMFYAKKHSSLVIYESRESGQIVDYFVRENPSIQKEIDINFRILVKRSGN